MEKVKCPHCKKEFPLEEGFKSHLKSLEEDHRKEIEKSFKEEKRQNEIKLEKLQAQNQIKDKEIKSVKALQESAIKNARADEKLKGETERQKEKLKIQRLEKDLEKMRKKIEQGGSADQGSGQEIILLDYLKNTVFKNNREDTFYPYGKGEKGGDVLQEVVEKGQLIGKILYESKNTDSFSGTWVTKLHQDMSDSKSDVGIFFTRALPKYFNKEEDYHKDNNVFICKYDWTALRTLASINRILLIKAKKIEKNEKGNQIGVIDFFNESKVKNSIPIMMNSYKAVRPSLVKVVNNAEKALEDHDDSYKRLLDLFEKLSEVGVDLNFEK